MGTLEMNNFVLYAAHLLAAAGLALVLGLKPVRAMILAVAILVVTYADIALVNPMWGWRGLLYTLLCIVCLLASVPRMLHVGEEPLNRRRLVALGAILFVASIGLQLAFRSSSDGPVPIVFPR